MISSSDSGTTRGTTTGLLFSSKATKVRNDVAAIFRRPLLKSSVTILTKTSIELFPVQVTNDSRQTESVGRIGIKKSTESIEAVTTDLRQCLAADMEAI